MPYADPVKYNEYQKQYRQAHREKAKEYAKEYRVDYNKTPQEIKRSRIKAWKNLGIKAEDFEEVYDYYIMSTYCENCWKELSEGVSFTDTKHLDHNHTTGEIRGILCGYCNLNDVFKNC